MRKTEKICPVCGKQFIAVIRTGYSVKSARKTCSKKCAYELRVKDRRNKVAITCPVCKKEFEVHPFRIKNAQGNIHCSIACAIVGRKRDPLKLSIHGCETLASGKTFPIPEIEFEVAEKLHNANIEFVHQWVVIGDKRAFLVDFYLPDFHAVIEIDNPNHHNRSRVKPRDKQVDECLAQQGVAIYRIIDDGNAEAIYKRIRKAIGI